MQKLKLTQEALINEATVTGERYGAQSETEVDTERFDAEAPAA